MKHSLRALAFLAALLPSWALAQSAPAVMPYHTVYGRLGAAPGDTGPGQAIPFATITAQLFGSLCTTNNAMPVYSTAQAKWICTPNQTANTVLAGPSSGGATQGSYRSLVSLDVPQALTLTSLALNGATLGTGNLAVVGTSILPTVAGGSAAGAALTIESSSNATPSADILNLNGGTVNIGNRISAATTVNLGTASGGGTTVNIGSASNGLTSFNVFTGAGSKQTWISGGGNTTATFPATTDTLVGKATTDVLTNKTFSAGGTGNVLTLRSATVQKFTTGTGATYTTPATSSFAIVKFCGPGGGGSGSGTGTTGGTGGTGTSSVFNSITCTGGAGATASLPGAGGTCSGGSPTETWAGSSGGIVQTGVAGNFIAGGIGGNTVLFAGGSGGAAGVAGTGAGGSGGTFNGAGNSGGGGGGGGCASQIVSGAGATYTYTVGTAGGAGTAGTSGTVGFAGSTGYLQATEY